MDNSEFLIRNLGLQHFFRDIKSYRAYKDKGLPYTGIYIATGSQGSGKTMYIMHLVDYLKKYYPKLKWYANMDIPVDYDEYTGLECFDDTNGEDGIVYVLDEIHTMYSNFDSAKMAGEMLAVWSQNRKNRRLILATAQRFERVAKPIREQTTFNIECKNGLFKIFKKYRVIDATLYDQNGKLPYDYKPTRYYHYLPDPDVINSYDSRQVIHSTSEIDDILKGDKSI